MSNCNIIYYLNTHLCYKNILSANFLSCAFYKAETLPKYIKMPSTKCMESFEFWLNTQRWKEIPAATYL